MAFNRLGYVTKGLFIFLITVASCKHKSSDDIGVMSEMEKGFKFSNEIINRSTSAQLHELQEKTVDGYNSERASVWYPKALKVSVLSTEIYNYIDSLKELQTLSESTGKEVAATIIKYKTNLALIDSVFSYIFSEDIYPQDSALSIKRISSPGFLDLFVQKPMISIRALLSRVQNHIKIIEDNLVAFCNTKVSTLPMILDISEPVITQNSKILEPGGSLEIFAWIGAFSNAAEPVVTVDGIKISKGTDGITHYILKAGKQPGRYKLPVEIQYKNSRNGKIEVFKSNVEYQVSPLCQ